VRVGGAPICVGGSLIFRSLAPPSKSPISLLNPHIGGKRAETSQRGDDRNFTGTMENGKKLPLPLSSLLLLSLSSSSNNGPGVMTRQKRGQYKPQVNNGAVQCLLLTAF
jgi:hypothetical protein